MKHAIQQIWGRKREDDKNTFRDDNQDCVSVNSNNIMVNNNIVNNNNEINENNDNNNESDSDSSFDEEEYFREIAALSFETDGDDNLQTNSQSLGKVMKKI